MPTCTTPKRTRKETAQQTADTAPSAAPQTALQHWSMAAPPRPLPGETNIPARPIEQKDRHSFCIRCGAKGRDHADGERGCILRKRALRAECNILDMRKAGAMFRRWLAWAKRVNRPAK